MTKERIKNLIEDSIGNAAKLDTGIKGVELFRVTEAMRCAPAIYEPAVIAIVSGSKEAILDGKRYEYDSSRYMCCPISMPVEAGTPNASPDNPLLGVYISLDMRIMTELAIEMETAAGSLPIAKNGPIPQSLTLSRWDDSFTTALHRLLELGNNPMDSAILGDSRLRELYYAILKGDAGASARRAFGVGNEIARAITYMSANLNEPITIEDTAAQVGMSRAVFHRKFKQATTMSPIQFVKSMRLNNAAMKIASGMNVSEAALGVGYISSSQFSREFKRMYGQSPKQWSHSVQIPAGVV